MGTPLIVLAPGPDGGGPAAAATPAIAARSPFRENADAHRVALAFGFKLVRAYPKIEIYDEKALIAAGLTVSKPKLDYARIGRLLDLGQIVEGARLSGFEYVLHAC